MKRSNAMHISIIKSKQGGKVYKSKLLRRSYREDGKVKKETIANLSFLDDRTIELLRDHLRGATLAQPKKDVEIIKSRSHGDVKAVSTVFRELDFINLINSRRCRERDIVCAMVAARIIRPRIKLTETHWWHNSTLPQEFNIEDFGVEELHTAMDWLLQRQKNIQGKLAKRLFQNDGLSLYYLASTYFDKQNKPPARFEFNSEGNKRKSLVNFGLLCDVRGCPSAVTVCPKNFRDIKTILPGVERLRKQFGLECVVFVGDRGMIKQSAIDALKELEGLNWISSLNGKSVTKLVRESSLDRIDEANPIEFFHPDFSSERLIAYRNSSLAEQQVQTRESLLELTEAELQNIQTKVDKGKVSGKARIRLRVSEVINHYRVKKYFRIKITDDSFDFERRDDTIAAKATLDGIYMLRTSLSENDLSASDCVRSYDELTQTERAFGTIKTNFLYDHSIYHHDEDQVEAHILIYMLAWYVEWNMRKAWRPLLIDDTTINAEELIHEPVYPVEKSKTATRKSQSQLFQKDSPIHSFTTLMENLATVVKNTCHLQIQASLEEPIEFEMTTELNIMQTQAMELLQKVGSISHAKPKL